MCHIKQKRGRSVKVLYLNEATNLTNEQMDELADKLNKAGIAASKAGTILRKKPTD